MQEAFQKLAAHAIAQYLRQPQPTIMHLVDCLQKQPASVNILEEYILWTWAFVLMASKKMLLLKNQKYEFTLASFLEQSRVFKNNLGQALQNEKQIAEMIRSKMIKADGTD